MQKLPIACNLIPGNLIRQADQRVPRQWQWQRQCSHSFFKIIYSATKYLLELNLSNYYYFRRAGLRVTYGDFKERLDIVSKTFSNLLKKYHGQRQSYITSNTYYQLKREI